VSAEVDYLVVGHVCVDLIGKRTVLGGSATYAALTARNLGARVGVVTSAGFEPGIVDALVGRENVRAAGTDIRVVRLPAQATTRFVNEYGPEGRRQQIQAVAELLRIEHVPPDWRGAPVVHLAPVAVDVGLEFVPAFPDALLGVTPPKPKKQAAKGRLQLVFESASKLPRRQQEKVDEFVEAFVAQQTNGRTR